jgi:hypothetical protein
MQDFSTIKTNILKYIEYKGISKYRFYKETGITRGVLDQNNGMSEENTARIIACYAEINPEWLLTGKGSMLKSEQTEVCPKSQEEKDTDKIKIIVLEKMLVEKDKRIENLNREVGKLLQMLEGFRDLQLKRCSKDTNASDANAG